MNDKTYNSSASSSISMDENYKGSVVKVIKQEQRFQLYRNGQPYSIKGAAGREKLEQLARSGGNTIRTWTTKGLDTLLEKADSLGINIMVGLYIGREREYFDYSDSSAVQKQRKRILSIVNQYKSHPAVLAWALGNEPELEAENQALWPEINHLAQLIHQADPNHPVTSVTTPRSPSFKALAKYCSELDFYAFNIFRDLKTLPDRIRNSPLRGHPYLVAEFGSKGYWETNLADWFAPMEQALPDKIATLKAGYEACIIGDSDQCLGGFVFYWGQKQERTHTWFSLFMENGSKTGLVDFMEEIWTGQQPMHPAPVITSITIEGYEKFSDYLKVDLPLKATVEVDCAKGDTLTYRWEILPEGNYDGIVGGDKEQRPKSLDWLMKNPDSEVLAFKTPSYAGAHRLFCHVYNQHGGGGYINFPFFVINNRLVSKELK